MKKPKSPLGIFKGAQTVGDLIKAFRANFSVSQDDMARACKMSQANLSAIEQNRREVGPRVALKLAAFMGISPDVLLYPNGYEAEPEYKEVRERYASIVPMVEKTKD